LFGHIARDSITWDAGIQETRQGIQALNAVETGLVTEELMGHIQQFPAVFMALFTTVITERSKYLIPSTWHPTNAFSHSTYGKWILEG
jgi:hypothetical protein